MKKIIVLITLIACATAYGLTVSDLRSESGSDIRLMYLDALISWAKDARELVVEEKRVVSALESRGMLTPAQKQVLFTKYDQAIVAKMQEQPTIAAIRQEYLDGVE